MDIEILTNYISTYGFAAVIVAFFIIKDLKFNNQILKVLSELKTIMQYISNHGGNNNANS